MSTFRGHLKNVLSLMVSGASSKIIVFLATIQIIKALPVADNGVYQLAYSLGFLYSLFAEIGIRGYLLRQLSRLQGDHEECQQLFSKVFQLRVFLSLGTLPLAALVTFALGYHASVVWFTFWLTLYAILDTFAVLLKFLLRAYNRMEFDPIFTMLGRGLLLVAVVVLVARNEITIGRVAAAHVISAVVELLGLLVVVSRVTSLRLFQRVTWQSTVEVFRASFPFAVVNVAGFLYLKIGLMILFQIKGEEAAAYFATAGRVPDASTFLPIALVNAFIPFFSRNASDLPLLQRYFAVITRYATFAGAALMAYFLFETPFVILAVSKPDYLVAASAFQWYGVWVPIAFLQLIVANLLVCLDEEKRLMSRYLLSVVANTVLNLLLIPQLGVLGAAIALVGSEVIAIAYGVFMLHGRGIRLPVSMIAEAFSVTLVVWLCSMLPIPEAFRILIGLIGVGVIVVGTFALRDRHILARVLRRES